MNIYKLFFMIGLVCLVAVGCSKAVNDTVEGVKAKSLKLSESSQKYYYYNGQKVPLTASNTEYVVTYKDQPKLTAQSATNAFSGVLPDKADIEFSFANAAKYTISSVKAMAMTSSSFMDSIKSNAAVLAVNPVYSVNGVSAYVTDTIIYQPKSGQDDAVVVALKPFNAVQVEKIVLGTMAQYVVSVGKPYSAVDVANALYESGLVVFAHPNFISQCQGSALPNDTYFGSQWFLNSASDCDIDAPEAWSLTQGSSSVVVAVMDGNGFDLQHSDLQSKFTNPYNAVNDTSVPSPENSYANHGTPCAGLVGAITNNGIGVASIGNAIKVMPVLIGYGASQNGGFYTSDSIISRAVSKIIGVPGVVAVSNSWGGGGQSDSRNQSFNLIRTQARGGLGAVVLFASGNSYSSSVSYPASIADNVAVGATDSGDHRASFSNYGSMLDIVAPGVNCYTTDRTGSDGYNSGDYMSNFSGTSAACPIAAGVVGLMASVNPNLTEVQLRALLLGSCDKAGGYSYSSSSSYPNGTWNTEMGYGRLNAYLAVLAAKSLSLPDTLVLTATSPKQSEYRSNLLIQAGSGFTVSATDSVVFRTKEVQISSNFDVVKGGIFDISVK